VTLEEGEWEGVETKGVPAKQPSFAESYGGCSAAEGVGTKGGPARFRRPAARRTKGMLPTSQARDKDELTEDGVANSSMNRASTTAS